ncbi:MAG TPA: winged helix-turn-helix domain-containing protein [Terriglobales bacterium]|nr:winged helix-turn-helix domain-containing protein [Terriglobales bacterium]
MQEEIGKTAGAIWDELNTRGEQSLSELKKAVKGKEPTFDWAIGWLARENQIVIMPEKRSFRIRLRHEHAKATGAS